MSTKAVDQLVQSLMESSKVQGLGLAMLNKNKITYVKSYGYRNKSKNLQLDTASIVYGASFSKAVFGYLVSILVDAQAIDLDKPLYQYLPKPIPDYAYFSDLKTDERWKLITGRMCLNHTTGLPNVRYFSSITGELDTLGVLRLYFTPGSKYAYSGEGFKLLQLVVESITHKTTDELAVEKIFQPLGMNRTGYVWHDDFGEDNVAVGHLNDGSIDVKKKRREAVAGGSLVTTIADYARFVGGVMAHKGLSEKGYQEMIRPQIAIHSVTQFPPITTITTTENDSIGLSYGLGWGLFTCDQQKVFFKEGNGGSWRNYNIIFPAKGTAVIILSNSENGDMLFQPLLESILGKTCIPWKWQGWTSVTQK